MDLRNLLPPNHIVVGLKTAARRELLAQLAAPLLKTGIVTDLEVFLSDVERREDEISTQITHDIAIPHARSNAVRRLGFTVGIAPAPGLMFNPAAGHTCRVFFLVAVPSFSPTAHLKLLQHIVHFANDAKKMPKLLSVRTPGQAVTLLVNFKSPA